MEHCQKCGRQLSPGQKFCTECGAEQTGEAGKSQPTDSLSQSRTQLQSRHLKPLFQSKKSKILAASIAAILVIFFGVFKYIESTLTPEKVAEQFADAVKTENVNKMESILNHNRPELEISEDSTAEFIAYFKKHPDVFSDTLHNLNNDARSLELNKSYINSKNPVSIVRDGKKWLLFNHYALNPKLYYIDVTSNKNDTELSINSKSVGKISDMKRTFGPFLLSDFKMKGSYQGKYTLVQTTKLLDPIVADSAHLTVKMDLTGNTVTIYSDNDTAILYVNGKSTGQQIKDITNSFGPVPIDGSMKLQAVSEEGSKTTKSNQETITAADQEVDLTFADTASASSGGGVSADSYNSDVLKGDIRQVVEDHYSDISSGDYEAAFNLMSSKLHKKYNFTSWSNQLGNNWKNDVAISDIRIVDNSDAVVQFTLTSYDNESDGSTLVQKWGGTWNLIKESNQWLLDVPNISKLDSYTE